MKFLFKNKIIVFYFIAVTIIISLLFNVYFNNQKVKSTGNLVEHTQEVLRKSDNVLLGVLSAETALRGYKLTGSKVFLDPLTHYVSSVNNNLEDLDVLTKDNVSQQLRVNTLKELSNKRLLVIKNDINEWEKNRLNKIEKKEALENGKILTDEIRVIIADINSDEFSLLKQRKLEYEKNNKNSDLLFVLLIIFTGVIFLLVIFLIKNQRARNKVAEELKQSTDLFSNLFDFNPASISISRLSDGKILNINDSFIQLFGFNSKDEVIGKTFDELNVFVNSKYSDEIKSLIKQTKIAKDFETNIITQDGKTKWISASMLFLEVDNSPCLFSVSIDTSKRKETEEQLLAINQELEEFTYSEKKSSQYARSLIEASLDPLVTISIDGKITDVNEASINITGIPREQLIGNDFSIYFTEPKKAQEGYQQVFDKGFVSDYPLTIKHNDGKLTDVLYNASVYKDGKGNVLGVFAAARDITVQKQSSQYARSLIEASLDPLVTISIDGKITDVNEASIKVTGVPRDQLIGTDFSIYFTEPKRAQEGYQQVFEKGFVSDYPLTIKHNNGKLTDVLYNASVYKDGKGNVLGVFAAARDITVQKQSSQYARSLIEASLDPLVTISIDGKITDVNEASIKVTGIQRDQLVGTDFSNYFTEPRKAQEGYQQVFEKGFVSDYPLTIKHKNGKLTDVLYNASVYKDDKGNVLGVFAAARDVTAQKLLSKYSLSLIEATLDPLVTINIDGKITDMNEAKVNITGVEREILIGSNFFDYFTEPYKAREVYKEVFLKGYVIDCPLTFRHINGKLTDVLFSGAVYKDDRGNVLGAVVVARDITEQKIFENELIEAKSNAVLAMQKAEESNKLKEAFLANMSHEIRTPMNAIIGFSDILSKRDLGEQEKEYVLTIKTAGENLLTIINDILDISKIEAGMMSFEEHTFSIQEIFISLNVMLMEKAREKNLELLFNYDSDVPDILVGDNTRLTQIIINLAGNAIKFTQEGKVEVRAKVLKSDAETALLEFSVTDTGIGIPQDKLDHIFERFRQAESHTTRKYGGTGLGLSIAKQLAELQGGTLSVKSELGVGSVFSFCIPYKKSKEIQTTQTIIERKYNMEDLSKLNILLVEDNKLNIKLILSLFSEYNLKLEIAENGSLGVEKLKEKDFDIILMDMEMPVMNGYEAATIIRRELKNNIPIIAMTAHAMAGERERCLNLGMNDYISKPINASLLFEKMHELTFNT